MLTIHHLEVSQSERIVWLCEELGVPYTLKRYARDPVTRLAPPEYRALHPMGIAPVIEDDGLVLAESGAIIEYVLSEYGGGRLEPEAGSKSFPDYLFWVHFANGTMVPSEMLRLFSKLAGPMPANPIIEALLARSTRAHALCESRLGQAPYFAGADFTAADIIMLFPLATIRAFTGQSIASYPNISAYLTRIGERPAFRRAMQQGDPGRTPNLT